MMVAKLLPLLVMAGVGVHSKDAIKERVGSVLGVGHNIVARQRMMAICEAATLRIAAGAPLRIRSDAEFRKWVRKAVKVKNKGDPSKDMWGKYLQFRLKGDHLILISAGPDGKFRSKDDIKISADLYDY